jgi:hypothetical protein
MLPCAAEAKRPTEAVLIQVTHNTAGEVWNPRIRSEPGDSIVFVSDGDVEGPGTAPGHREVYLYDANTRGITRITNTTDGESYEAARETDLTHSPRPAVVAFISTGDLDPSVGNADHNPELFQWTRSTGEFLQITDTTAPVVNAEPYTSDSGKCIAFRSSADLANNDGSYDRQPDSGFRNPDGSDEVFRLWFNTNDYVERVFTQVSDSPPGTTNRQPVIGGFWYPRQCRATAYQSDHDQLGNGSSGTHIYNFTKTTARLEQVSMPGPGNNTNPNMSSASNFARGPFVVWQSESDPIGNGATGGLQVFRFRVFRPELIQYTISPLDSTRPVVSDGGGMVVFQSSADLFDLRKKVKIKAADPPVPPFNADGNAEIFRAKGTRKLTQITMSEGCENTHPTMRDTAGAMAFRSTCDLVPGNNPNGVPQVFHYFQIRKTDPLFSAENCKVAEGCCNVANGCYAQIDGKKERPRRSRLRPPWASES